MTTIDKDLRGINFEEGYIAVIDKPLYWTSADVVRKIKYALRCATSATAKSKSATPAPSIRWLRAC